MPFPEFPSVGACGACLPPNQAPSIFWRSLWLYRDFKLHLQIFLPRSFGLTSPSRSQVALQSHTPQPQPFLQVECVLLAPPQWPPGVFCTQHVTKSSFRFQLSFQFISTFASAHISPLSDLLMQCIHQTFHKVPLAKQHEATNQLYHTRQIWKEKATTAASLFRGEKMKVIKVMKKTKIIQS